MTASVAAVIASRRDDGDWADLDLAVRSLRHYAPGLPVVVAWSGPVRPDVPADVNVRQPDDCATFGAAYQFAVSRTNTPKVLLVNDDVVLCPDSYRTLAADFSATAQYGPVGFVAACADYARPEQQTLQPPHQAHVASVVSPYFALVERDALPAVWPDCNWYSDDIMCADMADTGRTHWVSRSWVHHLGERSTGRDYRRLDADGRAWVRANRPDLAGRIC